MRKDYSIKLMGSILRQTGKPLDCSSTFDTIAALEAYLLDPTRYAGQTVSCSEKPHSLFILNGDMNAWIEVATISDGNTITLYRQLTKPPKPDVGRVTFYFRDDGNLYKVDENNVESLIVGAEKETLVNVIFDDESGLYAYLETGKGYAGQVGVCLTRPDALFVMNPDEDGWIVMNDVSDGVIMYLDKKDPDGNHLPTEGKMAIGWNTSGKLYQVNEEGAIEYIDTPPRVFDTLENMTLALDDETLRAGEVALCSETPKLIYVLNANKSAWLNFTNISDGNVILLGTVAQTPSNPSEGYVKIYIKSSNGRVYKLNSAGKEVEVGAGVLTYKVASTAYTLTNDDDVFNYTGSQPATLTLQAAEGATSKRYTILNNGTGALTVQGTGVDVILLQEEAITVFPTGTAWLMW